MTIELELDDLLALVEAATGHGTAVLVAHDDRGERALLKVARRIKPRKREALTPREAANGGVLEEGHERR